MAAHPTRSLRAHGTAVGLPSDADMGNSEVGHNAMGAGRVFDQGAKLVDHALIDTDEDDVTYARRLAASPGVATVPGSSFYSRPELGRKKIRFAFPKKISTLEAAAERLATLRADA